MTALAPHLSAYLREHLPRERAVSPHTVKTYANCFVLLVQFAADRLKRRPTDLEIEDFGTDMIMAFLDHVETGRGSCVRTRNGRLAAIRSFFRYIEYRIPACLDQALRVRSIPTKKTDKALIDYLDRAEIKALFTGKLEAVSLGRFQELTGIRIEGPDGSMVDDLPSIQRWLNRILALPIALQNAIFDEFMGLVEARIGAARQAGTLDIGVETIAVEHYEVLTDTLPHRPRRVA